MTEDQTFQAIREIANKLQDLQQKALQQYRPIVNDILYTKSRDIHTIEHTLDGMLDFCGHEQMLLLYKKLCRHYWEIDPEATAFYINAYRELWDSDEEEKRPV